MSNRICEALWSTGKIVLDICWEMRDHNVWMGIDRKLYQCLYMKWPQNTCKTNKNTIINFQINLYAKVFTDWPFNTDRAVDLYSEVFIDWPFNTNRAVDLYSEVFINRPFNTNRTVVVCSEAFTDWPSTFYLIELDIDLYAELFISLTHLVILI